MAATITDFANSTSLGGSSPASLPVYSASAGEWLLILIAASNDGSGGATSYSSVSVSSAGGGTVSITDRANILYDPGAAGAGANLIIVTVEILTTVTSGQLQVNWVGGAAPTEGSAQIYKYAPGAGEAISFVAVDTTGSTGNASTYSAPTVSVTNGDTITGAAAIETDDAITGDTDTTNGNWSSILSRLDDNGADASTMVCSSQWKTVNATGNQSWACTSSTARDSARTYIVLRSASTGVSADLSKTLGTLTLSGAYSVDTNTGDLTKTLGALTLSSAFSLDTNTADLSKTLGALTSTADFTVESLFSLNATLGPVTLSSTFEATAAETTLDLAKTLGALTSSAAFTVETNADLSKTLGALSLVSAFSLDTNTADLAKTLGTLTLSSSVTVNTVADLAKTLGSLSLSATYSVSDGPELSLTQTLGSLSLAADYSLDTNSAEVSKVLGALTVVSSFDVTGGPVVVSEPEDGPHGPGWKLYGQDARPSRKRKVEDLEQEIIRAYEDATGITAEREQLAAVRELKRAAATALSVAKKENDEQLKVLAERLIALKKFELTAQAYLERAGDIIADLQMLEEDDMEALILMARLAA